MEGRLKDFVLAQSVYAPRPRQLAPKVAIIELDGVPGRPEATSPTRLRKRQ